MITASIMKGLIIEMMIQKNLKGLKNRSFDQIPCERFFLAINIIAIYILLQILLPEMFTSKL